MQNKQKVLPGNTGNYVQHSAINHSVKDMKKLYKYNKRNLPVKWKLMKSCGSAALQLKEKDSKSSVLQETPSKTRTFFFIPLRLEKL